MCTTGERPRIFGMLSSLQQLSDKDFLTIVFDGKEKNNLTDSIIEYANEILSCKINIIYSKKKLGYWGHAARNRFQSIITEGNFLWYVDDDDVIPWNAVQGIRNVCTDLDTLYLFHVFCVGSETFQAWSIPGIF